MENEFGSQLDKSLLKQADKPYTEYHRFTDMLDSMGIYWTPGYVFLKDPKDTQKVDIGDVTFFFVNGDFKEWVNYGEAIITRGR
jgi:hypothetical protein